mmetsp:Transcript_46899/g.106191  ORF Transcript_46899/g.106191 Transcript_46899/m.106191 type:complete len:226 (+) Transcript_46899:196-873(+)
MARIVSPRGVELMRAGAEQKPREKRDTKVSEDGAEELADDEAEHEPPLVAQDDHAVPPWDLPRREEPDVKRHQRLDKLGALSGEQVGDQGAPVMGHQRHLLRPLNAAALDCRGKLEDGVARPCDHFLERVAPALGEPTAAQGSARHIEVRKADLDQRVCRPEKACGIYHVHFCYCFFFFFSQTISDRKLRQECKQQAIVGPIEFAFIPVQVLGLTAIEPRGCRNF